MQIKGLRKNIYRLYAYARTQECLDAYRATYQEKVSQWETRAIECVTQETAQAILGFSRATYIE
jgi:putative transposase